MGIQMDWNDAKRVLRLRLASGSRVLASRKIEVKLQEATRTVEFKGVQVEVAFLSMLPRLLAVCLALTLSVPGFAQNTSSQVQVIQAALRAKDFTQALKLAGPALQQFPKEAKLWMLQGVAFAGLSKNKEALISFHKALDLSPDNLAALEGAVQLEYRSDSAHAIPHLDRILQQMPNDLTAHAMLAVAAYKQHDCATAVKHFEQSAQLIASQPSALAEYGACLMELDRAPDAAVVFQQIVTQFPENSHARFALASAQLAAHQGKEAVETLQPLLEAKEPEPDVLALASSAYEGQGDTPKAVQLLRQAIVANPKKIKYYLDFATLSFNHQSFQVGIDMVNVGLKQTPNAAPLYVARGVLYIQMARYEQGEADFQAATRLNPRESSGAIAQGMAQIQQSNLDEALATVNSQIKIHPREAFLYYLKAQILVQKGTAAGTAEFKEAIAAATRATQLNPDFVLPRDILGNLYLKSGQLDLAIAQCRLALHTNPSDQESLYHLIQALRQSGKGSKTEMADLVKQLADLRRESREQEGSANQYKLYEILPNEKSEQPPQ
jgi:tetratricopeptide (TPR) repeat protein